MRNGKEIKKPKPGKEIFSKSQQWSSNYQSLTSQALHESEIHNNGPWKYLESLAEVALAISDYTHLVPIC